MLTRRALEDEVRLILTQSNGNPREAAFRVRERARLDDALATGQRLTRPAAAARANDRAEALRAHARLLEQQVTPTPSANPIGNHRPAA